MALKAPPKAGSRRLDYAALADLVPALRNPKRHDLDELVTAIRRFGFMDIPLVDERTGRLIAGHGRLEALLVMEATKDDLPDGLRAVDGVWHVPIQRGWESLDDAEAEGALLAANKIGARAGYEPVTLASILQDLGGHDPQLVADAGFTPDELADAMRALIDVDPPSGDGQAPGDGFPAEDGNTFQCPRCGHEWNGDPR